MKRKRTTRTSVTPTKHPDEGSTMPPGWDVGSVAELRTKYGLSLKKWARPKLNSANVPDPLRSLIPLAEFWGIADDIVRAELLEDVGESKIQELNAALEPFDQALAEWLGNPKKAKTWSKTDEYAAFSCMVNAADGF